MKLSEALLNQLKYAVEHSAFYKKKALKFPISVENIKTLEDFQTIPLTDKDEFSQWNEEFLAVPKNKIVEIVSTSGTTGEPIPFYYSAKDIQRLTVNESLAMKIAGIDALDVVQLMTTSDKLFVAGLAYQLGIREIGAAMIRVGPLAPAQQWKYIFQFSPSVLIAVPSFVLKLLLFAETNKLDYLNSKVKKIICIGEPIRYQDFKLNVLGQKIQEKWPNVQLFSTYASTEMSTAFTECSAGLGGHVLEDLIFIEILDENEIPVSPGTVGELVITTLKTEAIPLIRFKTGDICACFVETCPCGRLSPRLGPILGRKKQMIKYKGTTFYPFALKDILAEIPEIESYYIEISQNELALDDVKIYVFSNLQSADLQNNIKNIFQTKIRVCPEIIFETKEKIESILAMNFRKPNDVIDLRKSY